jgi:hypothetical protein
MTPRYQVWCTVMPYAGPDLRKGIGCGIRRTAGFIWTELRRVSTHHTRRVRYLTVFSPFLFFSFLLVFDLFVLP